jgi:hypothetical protein
MDMKQLSIRVNRLAGKELRIEIESNVAVPSQVLVALFKLYERLEEE